MTEEVCAPETITSHAATSPYEPGKRKPCEATAAASQGIPSGTGNRMGGLVRALGCFGKHSKMLRIVAHPNG